MRADTGPIGGKHSHEFLVLADTGESEVYFDSGILELRLGDRKVDFDSREECAAIMEEWTRPYARTDETHDQEAFEREVPEAARRKSRGIEVGQIFYFGSKYSEPMGAFVVNADGERVPVHMGSHGIGVSRLAGAIIEAKHDEKGIIWPESVSPFHVGIINLAVDDNDCVSICDKLCRDFETMGLEPLYDDRPERAGTKFATMDLIGLPWRITVGPKNLRKGAVELTCRETGETEELPPSRAVERVKEIYSAA